MDKILFEYRDPSTLIDYVRNPRKNDSVIDRMIGSITEFGFPLPILIKSTNEIIDGHLRAKAARKMGLSEVPVVIADHLSEAQIKAFRLLANRSANWADFDVDLLKIELEELKQLDFNLKLTGFDAVELDGFLFKPPESKSGEGEDQISAADELQQKWAVNSGDLWQCGNHRIICGDCTDATIIHRLLNDTKPVLLLTDPPYGIKADKGFSGSCGFAGKSRPIARRTYKDDWDSNRPSFDAFSSIITLAEASIIWGGNFFADLLPPSTHWIVWDKLNTMPTFGDCELAWTSLSRKSVKKYQIEYNGHTGKEKQRYHPTQKPVKLFTALLNDYSKPGESILDVYAGSGTTLIACEHTKRIAYCVEREPAYVSVMLERYQLETKQEPVLLSNNQSTQQSELGDEGSIFNPSSEGSIFNTSSD